jgi:glyoxylase-like metal-dependent hydrolase (beta-lactamase superfamily II)
VSRQLKVFLDRSWTKPLPIYAWAIEHPEGVIVVDTGDTARTSEPGYLPRWHPYYRLAASLDVAPEQEIGPQLRRRCISPDDVRAVVLTHLHTDHAGGLHHFPNSDVFCAQAEYRLVRGFGGRLRGYLPNRWPGLVSAEAPRLRPGAVWAF